MAEDVIENRSIRIDEVESKQDKIILKEGKDKYQFWIKKRDGNFTKAYEGWSSLQPLPGDVIDIQFKSEDVTWEKGTYVRRTVLSIRPSKGGEYMGGSKPTPVANEAPSSNSEATGASYVTREEYENKIKEMAAAFMLVQADVVRIKTAIGLTDED